MSWASVLEGSLTGAERPEHAEHLPLVQVGEVDLKDETVPAPEDDSAHEHACHAAPGRRSTAADARDELRVLDVVQLPSRDRPAQRIRHDAPDAIQLGAAGAVPEVDDRHAPVALRGEDISGRPGGGAKRPPASRAIERKARGCARRAET